MDNEKIMTYQLNPLMNAQKEFNVIETRLFYLGLKDINPHLTEKDIYFDKEFPDTHITPAELKEIFGNGKYLSEIKKACKRIGSTSIEIEYNDGFDIYTVFRHLKYREKDGLHIQFNEDMKPFLLDIYKGYKKYGFTKIEMQQIFVLGSAYAMRLLEMLLQFSGKKKKGVITREIPLEELRHRLAVPVGSYKQMCNFRHIVLDLPIAEIERKTPYRITYKTVKKGRSVIGFTFICNCNNATDNDDYTETIEVESYEEKLEEAGQEKLMDYPSIAEQKANDELYKRMKGYGFRLDVIGILLQDYCGGNIDELKARLEYGERRANEDIKKKKIKNNSLAGYLRKAIEQDWAGQHKAEEQAQARELEASQLNAEWELWALQQGKDEPAPKKPEKQLDVNNPMHQTIINTIKKDLLERRMTITSKNLLDELGLTVSRFAELYMKG